MILKEKRKKQTKKVKEKTQKVKSIVKKYIKMSKKKANATTQKKFREKRGQEKLINAD